jgi:HlyD family secretion protein
MKRKIPRIVLVLLLAAGGYWGYRWYNQTPAAGLKATGTIEATQVQLTVKLSGTLQDFTVKDGDPVRKGQLIGSLLRSDLVAQRERDALGVIKAQAQLNDLLSGARQQELRDAEIAVSTAEINYEKAGKGKGTC